MRRELASALFAVALAGAHADAAHAAGPAAAPPPIRFTRLVEKVVVVDKGAKQTLYKVGTDKPLRLETAGAMTLLLLVRPFVDAAAAPPMLTVAVTSSSGGPAAATQRHAIAVDDVRIAAGAGLTLAGTRVIRVPIAATSAKVEIRVDAGQSAAVGFARGPFAPPTAPVVAVAPKPTRAPQPTTGFDDSVLDAIPMIRRSVEHFSVGPKGGVIVPVGADVGWGGSQNLYAGAELRFTPPQLERRLSLGIEASIFEVRDRDTIVGAQPIGSSEGGDVVISTRVVPVLAGVSYRFPIGESAAVCAGGGAGAAFARRTEHVRFRANTTESGASGAGFLRLAADRKVGRGRAISLEATWLHSPASGGAQLGGLTTAVHYRLVY